MPIYEREETYDYDIEIRDEDGILIDPDTVKITITDPNGDDLVSLANMTQDDTGKYSYNYDIPATAEYGEWTTVVTATSAATTVTKFRSNFFVFRFNIINKIRRFSGVGKESISDEDISEIGMEALKEGLEEVFDYHKDVKPICDPDYGVLFNGSNKVVRTPHRYLADYNFDGEVSTNTLTGEGDVTGWWYDSDYDRDYILISVTNEDSGRISITDSGGSAIPADHNGVYLSYHTRWETYNEKLFEDAVAYLAAHNLILRMTEAHQATAADLPSNQKKIELNLRRFHYKYREIMNKISKPLIEGV